MYNKRNGLHGECFVTLQKRLMQYLHNIEYGRTDPSPGLLFSIVCEGSIA